jgi:hypothetical protein
MDTRNGEAAMKRILLLLALLPSLVSADEIIITNSGTSGLWTNTAVWTGGVVPNSATQTAVIANSALISNTTAVALSNLIVNTGTLNLTGNNISVGGTLTQAGGYIVCTPQSSRLFNIRHDRVQILGGTFTNCTISLTSLGDISVLASNVNVKNLRVLAIAGTGNLSVLSVTNTAFDQIQIGAGSGLVISNVHLLVMPWIRCTGGNVPFNFVASSGTTSIVGSSSSNKTTLSACSFVLNGLGLQANAVLTAENCNLSAFGTVVFPSNSTVTNSTLTITGAATLTPASAVFDVITSSATLTLAGACTTPSFTNNARLNLNGNAFTPTAFYSTGTLAASNSTITVSNFVNSATFTHSGVTRMLDGGVFNSTNGATLSVVSGNVTLATNTVLSGTIYSEAPSASLNLSGGTLTVTGQSLFAGTISNGVIGASAPVTAERTHGVSGRINSIEQMGAE